MVNKEIQKYTDLWEGEIKDVLECKFSGKLQVTLTETRRVYVKAQREAIHDICKTLHDELNFEHCATVIGVDMKDHMEVIYHILNYTNFRGTIVEITIDVPNDDLHVLTVSDIWGGANWHERETWELFGIVFDGHPRLERLLTPKTYKFFPFRKSYKLRGWDE